MADGNETDSNLHNESEDNDDKNISKRDKSGYKQRYKHAWELDPELKEWLTACPTDLFAGYCKYCRCKLHAHKKGLLSHAKSTKHKKNFENFDPTQDVLALLPVDNFGGDLFDDGGKRNFKGQRVFNDLWLNDPMFSEWLRKVPTNNTKALCIACRCVISAGKAELIKHTKAAKHVRAIADGNFTEINEADLQWLNYSSDNITQSNVTYGQQSVRPANDLPGMNVEDLIERLNTHVPLMLAEEWDNVGVMVKPPAHPPTKVHNVLITIDLNEKVVQEAIKKRVQLIITYHPPIFQAVKNLDPKGWMANALTLCQQHRIAVYSPHTALDAIKGGINDWLISSFISDNADCKVRPIVYSINKQKNTCFEVLLQGSHDTIAPIFSGFHDVTLTDCPGEQPLVGVKVLCDEKTLPELLEQLSNKEIAQINTATVTKLDPTPIPGTGMGRIAKLSSPLSLGEIIQRIKSHLDLRFLRMAAAPRHSAKTEITTVAVCAGSGASILKKCKADVWITGEMSHHEILDAINKGTTVLLCEHSNTERGFLKEWAAQLSSTVLENLVSVGVSETDRDPLRIV